MGMLFTGVKDGCGVGDGGVVMLLTPPSVVAKCGGGSEGGGLFDVCVGWWECVGVWRGSCVGLGVYGLLSSTPQHPNTTQPRPPQWFRVWVWLPGLGVLGRFGGGGVVLICGRGGLWGGLVWVE